LKEDLFFPAIGRPRRRNEKSRARSVRSNASSDSAVHELIFCTSNRCATVNECCG
jgi:hypothetical protein